MPEVSGVLTCGDAKLSSASSKIASVLHFLEDSEDPWAIVNFLKDQIAPGSYVAISHVSDGHIPAGAAQQARLAYQGASAPGVPRTASTGFMRYWLDSSQPVSGPEERAAEYLALVQIWTRLRPKDRELLAAMAEHEDYTKAAAALGKPRHTYATEIGRARKAFRELWHEGETPSRPWGADRRASNPESPKMRVTYRLVRRRAAQARASSREAAKQRDTRSAAEQ